MSVWSAADVPEGRLADLARLRMSYDAPPMRLTDLPDSPGPAFEQWFADAESAGVIEPNAMTLATVGQDGTPAARTVLLKGVSAVGFSFFTNLQSRKGRQLAVRPVATLLFAWLPIFRQIAITGQVVRVSEAEADEYFATRPRGSQIAAWASKQSQALASDDELGAAWLASEQRFADRPVPRPPYWGGFEVRPHRVEFWQGQPSRMHDRVEFSTPDRLPGPLGDPTRWVRTRLSP
jgi:pyridoxamine 5'-phosphate oxidase